MSHQETNKNQIKSLSSYLWNKAIEEQYVDIALKTQFIQQIKTGTLHPELFGAFMIQDYQYQEEAAILFELAYQDCQKNNQHEIKDLIEPFMTKYRKRADSHFKKWRIKKNMADLSPACQSYIRIGREGLQLYGGKYVFALQYACRRLWPDLANLVKGYIPIQSNAYRFWIQRYQSDTPQSKMSNIIDKLYEQGKLDAEISWKLLKQCLRCDINFLKEPFEEQFLPVDYLMNIQESERILKKGKEKEEEKNVTL